MDLKEEEPLSSLNALVAEIARGVTVIREMRPTKYGLVGAQFRHNLDFVNAFLNGLAERRIDYNERTRDVRVETVPEYAIEQMLFAIRRLESLSFHQLDRLVLVRSEINEDRWHTSSVSREIEFLHSHTVHHFALIAKILSSSGHQVHEDVGVAPSTLRFRASAYVSSF